MLMNTGSISRCESWEPARQGSLPQFTGRLRLDTLERLADLPRAARERIISCSLGQAQTMSRQAVASCGAPMPILVVPKRLLDRRVCPDAAPDSRFSTAVCRLQARSNVFEVDGARCRS